MAEQYIDLLIEDDDLKLDADGIPVMTSDKPSIVQDICHAIRESGYAINMIGERNSEKRALLQNKILTIVEDDTRIIPGTAKFYSDPINFKNNVAIYTIVADTYQYGKAKIQIEGNIASGTYSVKSR